MDRFEDARAEHQRRRWMRPNAHLYIRHDAHRFMPPGSPIYVGRDVVKYFGRSCVIDHRKFPSGRAAVPISRTKVCS